MVAERLTNCIRLRLYVFMSLSPPLPLTNIILRPDGKEINVPSQNIAIPVPGNNSLIYSIPLTALEVLLMCITLLGIGSVVTFTYERNSRRDTVVNPTITRLRSDLEWEDVVASDAKDRRGMQGVRGEGYKSYTCVS